MGARHGVALDMPAPGARLVPCCSSGRTVQSVPQGNIPMAKTIAVLGAGNAGTTFSLLAMHNANVVRLWTIEQDLAEHMQRVRENPKYLPGVKLPEAMVIEIDLQRAVAGAEI